jgi:hypothetical protein
MPKAPKATPAAAPARASKRTVSVIYRPLEHKQLRIGPTGELQYGASHWDPPNTKWYGITFRANIPVELDPDNPAHFVAALLPKTYPGANGEMLTKHVESKLFMGELAKTNPSFEVDGVIAKRKKNTRVVPPPGAEWTEANEGVISDSDEIDRSVAA